MRSASEIVFVLRLWFASPLIAYIAVVVFGAVWFRRTRTRALRDTRPILHRVLLASYLALVFTPSIITDFWLFGFWGPALLGFFFLIPGTLVHVFSAPDINTNLPWYDFMTPRAPDPSAILLSTLKATGIYHLLPILGGFLIFYFSLWALSRFRLRAARQPI